jgi:hypothetical protein
MEDRRPKGNPRPERIVGQKRQHLLLSFPSALASRLFFDLGNTLVNEQVPTAARLQQIVAYFERHGHTRINAAQV